MRPLLYLGLRRLINSLKRAPSNPRVLLPGLFLVGMILLLILGGLHAAPHVVSAFRPREYITGEPGAVIAGLRTVLLISAFSALVASLGEGGIFFTPSDVDFLFPAPLSPRAVLFTQMLSRYGRLIFPAIYLPLVLGGSTLAAMSDASALALWPGMLGVWLFLMATTNLTQTALLGRRVSDDPEAEERSLRRRTIVRYVLYGIATICVVIAVGGFLWASANPGIMGRVIHTVLLWINGRNASRILLPVTWATDLVRVTFEGWTMRTLRDLLALLAVVGATFLLLFSRQRDFYEAALETSERRTRLITAVRSGDAGSILTQMAQDGKIRSTRTVTTVGNGALAVLWKDMIAITRTPARSWGVLMFVAAFPAILGVVIGGAKSDLAIFSWLVLFSVNMANLFLLSLRDMLRRADMTKALPIAPTRLLLGELGLSIVQLTGLGWFSLGLMALTGVARRGPFFLPIVLTLPALAALLLFVQTVFVLLYPRRQGAGGDGDAVQGGVASIVGGIGGGVALLPGLIVGASLTLLGASRLWLGIGVGLADLLAAFIALQIAALLWQRFDPSD